MDKKVLFLQKLAREKIELLKPKTSLESFCGYWYPEAQEAFEAKPGEEVEHLDHLAELGYLDRQFFDRIHLCPFCSYFVLNFREVCPRCESANIDIVEMIHHFRCGYAAPEVEFRDGVQYVCPKCKRSLRHIGVDYERPASNYLCASCKHIFLEPKVSCLCLKCGQAFGVERAVTRIIHVYRLTAKGSLAAARGAIEEAGLFGAFIDADFAVYTFRFFEEQLAQEIRRAHRYERPLSIMLASPDHLEAYEAKFGKEAKAFLLKAVALVIKEALRDSDVPALYGEMMLAILLPDTPFEGAYIAAERIRRKIFELNPPEREPKITLSVGLAILSDETGSAGQMIDAANEGLKEAKRAGGNCVRPAEVRLDPGQEFGRLYRLNQVIIGPCLEAPDPVLQAIPGRQEDDGNGLYCRIRFQGPADLEPIELGHHNVQEDEVRDPSADLRQGLFPAPCFHDREALRLHHMGVLDQGPGGPEIHQGPIDHQAELASNPSFDLHPRSLPGLFEFRGHG